MTRRKKKMPDRDAFRERLVQLRGVRAVTQAELATKAGLPPAAISHFETGFRFPTAPTLMKLADALAVSIDYLLGRVDDPVPVGPQLRAILRHAQGMTGESLKILEGFSRQLEELDRKKRKDGQHLL
jgi:transcriptional regulator with XRE-family HTH domain